MQAGASRIAIFGGRGSGAIVAQSVEALAAASPSLRLFGYLNDAVPPGETLAGVTVLGPFAGWRDLPDDVSFIAPLHKFGAMRARRELIESLGIPDDRWTCVIDPRSAVARDAIIGRGSFVGPFASVGPGAVVGIHGAIRAGAAVSHDCALGDFVFVGTNSVLSGYGKVADGVYIAPGVTIIDGCTIGEFATVGLGSVVTKDIPAATLVAGAPARAVRPSPATNR